MKLIPLEIAVDVEFDLSQNGPHGYDDETVEQIEQRLEDALVRLGKEQGYNVAPVAASFGSPEEGRIRWTFRDYREQAVDLYQGAWHEIKQWLASK